MQWTDFCYLEVCMNLEVHADSEVNNLEVNNDPDNIGLVLITNVHYFIV